MHWWQRIKTFCANRRPWSICNILCTMTDIQTEHNGNEIVVKPRMQWNARDRHTDDHQRQSLEYKRQDNDDNCISKVPLQIFLANQLVVKQEDTSLLVSSLKTEEESLRIPLELVPSVIEALHIFHVYTNENC